MDIIRSTDGGNREQDENSLCADEFIAVSQNLYIDLELNNQAMHVVRTIVPF